MNIKRLFAISLSRKVLNKKIEKYSKLIKGETLDIGGEKTNNVDHWNKQNLNNVKIKYLNIDNRYNPDYLGSVYEIPVKDSYFDSILCFELIEHLEFPNEAIKEISRVLKIGGRAFFSIPFMYRHHSNPRDFQRWTHEKIQKEFNTSRLEIEYFENRGGWLIVLFDVFINGILGFKKKGLFSFIFYILFQSIGKILISLSSIIIFFDNLILKSNIHSNYYRYTTGYFFVVKKSRKNKKEFVDYMRYPKKLENNNY